MPRRAFQSTLELASGVTWCLVCRAPADLEDPGEPFPRCVRCGHRKTEWREAADAGSQVQAPPADVAPLQAQPVTTRRLPADQRPSLSAMLEEYHFCTACNHITRLAEDGGCVLCGSSQVETRHPLEEGKL